jgi:tight adherence protein B
MTDPRVLVYPTMLVVGVALILLSRTRRRRQPADSLRLRRLQDRLVQAGVPQVRPAQLVLFCLLLGLLVAVLLAGVSSSLWIGLAFGVLAGYLPLLVLKARSRRRARELQEIWPDAIDNLSSGVRAGMSLPEAVAALADHGPEPLRPAFARFADVYHASGRFNDALEDLKAELADPTADRVVEALRLAREVGGTEVGRTLRILSVFLRDEYRVRKELEARQSWVIVAARLAFATPWFVLLMLSTKQESVAAYRGPGGAVVLAIGAVMATLGYRMMLAIGRIPTEERILR